MVWGWMKRGLYITMSYQQWGDMLRVGTILVVMTVMQANYDRALKHYMIAVGSGSNESLKMIQKMYKGGHATKDDYAKALKAYHKHI